MIVTFAIFMRRLTGVRRGRALYLGHVSINRKDAGGYVSQRELAVMRGRMTWPVQARSNVYLEARRELTNRARRYGATTPAPMGVGLL